MSFTFSIRTSIDRVDLVIDRVDRVIRLNVYKKRKKNEEKNEKGKVYWLIIKK